MHEKVILTLGLLAGLAGVAAIGCDEAPQFPEVVRPVKTMTVKGDPAGEVISLPGKTVAFQRVDMSFQISGRIKKDPYKKGQAVKTGDLLVMLDQTDFKISLSAARARQTEARAYLGRMKNAFEQKVATKAELDRAQAEFDIAKAEFDAADQNLKYTSLLAPFDGEVANKMFDEFQEIRAKEPVLTLQTSANIDIDVDIPATYMATMSEDDVDRTTVVFNDDPKAREFIVTKKEIAAEADPLTMTYRMTFTMPAPTELRILPGMPATVNAHLKEPEGDEALRSIVPVTAVKSRADGKRIVWIISKDNRASALEVTVGSITDRGLIITSGLKAGDTIATAGVHRIREGMRVRPMCDDPWESGK